MRTQFEDVTVEWQTAQLVVEFLSVHLADKRGERQNVYRRWMGRFVSFCCTRWKCNPSEIHFESCTVLSSKKGRILRPIQPMVIQEFLFSIRNQRSRHDAEVVLRVYFTYLVKRSLLDSNPVPYLDYPELNKGPKVGLSLNEIHDFVRVLKTWQQPYRAAIAVQLAAGLRVGELCALRVEDVIKSGEEEWTLAISREALKGKIAQHAPLPSIPRTLGEYDQWRKDNRITSNYLFVDTLGQPLNYIKVNQQIVKIGSASGCSRKVTSHDMRRAYATIIANTDDFQPDVLPQLMRQSHQRTAFTYVRPPDLTQVQQALIMLPVSEICNAMAKKFLTLYE